MKAYKFIEDNELMIDDVYYLTKSCKHADDGGEFVAVVDIDHGMRRARFAEVEKTANGWDFVDCSTITDMEYWGSWWDVDSLNGNPNFLKAPAGMIKIDETDLFKKYQKIILKSA